MLPLSSGQMVVLSPTPEEDCKVIFPTPPSSPPSPVVKIPVQGKSISNFFLRLCIAFRCWLRSGSSFRPPLTLTDWVVKDSQHLGQKLNFRGVCLLCQWQSLVCKVLSGTFYGFSYHRIPGQTTPISLLLCDPNYETSVIKQSYYNYFRISFLAFQVPGLTFSLTITEAVS